MKAKTIEELKAKVFEALGEASMCWNPLPSTQIFDSKNAERIGNELWSEIEKLIQDEPQKVEEEITIFSEKEYHFQFRDLDTLRGISDYKVNGKRLMQYLHNAELSLNNNKII